MCCQREESCARFEWHAKWEMNVVSVQFTLCIKFWFKNYLLIYLLRARGMP